jgi:hypothetical protein
MSHTAAPWEVPAANVFRVVAPGAPHENKPDGACPPYPWAIIAETDPQSVGGEQAAANARLIAAAPDLLSALKALRAEVPPYSLGSALLGRVTDAIAKAEGPTVLK